MQFPISKHKSGLYVRLGTYECTLPSEVVRSYGWLDIKHKSVLDIGANIGAFSKYALQRGASVVWAFEPDDSNFALLQKNAPEAHLYHAALISNNDIDHVKFYKTKSGKNPGNYSTVPFRNRIVTTVPAMGFQKVLDKFQPEIIKMDCEGAEYDLMKCTLPDSVQEIAMELHLTKMEFRRDVIHLIACFDTWEIVIPPKYNDKSWTCLFGVRKRQNSVIKSIKSILNQYGIKGELNDKTKQ